MPNNAPTTTPATDAPAPAELKCPFCGDEFDEPYLQEVSPQNGDPDYYYFVCMNILCCANGPQRKTPEAAIEAFCTRPTEAALRARVAELEAAIAQMCNKDEEEDRALRHWKKNN